jgi:hypothetical protein
MAPGLRRLFLFTGVPMIEDVSSHAWASTHYNDDPGTSGTQRTTSGELESIGVYLRLLGTAVPSSYGPGGDEMPSYMSK